MTEKGIVTIVVVIGIVIICLAGCLTLYHMELDKLRYNNGYVEKPYQSDHWTKDK